MKIYIKKKKKEIIEMIMTVNNVDETFSAVVFVAFVAHFIPLVSMYIYSICKLLYDGENIPHEGIYG